MTASIGAVKFGLVGYGSGARYFHAPLIASAPECELIGVVTTSPQRQALVANEFPGTPTFASLANLADSGIQAVTISTPAATHSALTDEALRLGLAVVCDKAFALDAAATRQSVGLSEQVGVPLSPYQNRRWDSEFLTVRKLVAAGALGAVTRFESRFERRAPQRGPGPAGGGTLLDFGSHLVDQALVLLGPVRSVYAEWRVRESGLDDDVFVALTHSSGPISHLWGGWSQSAPGPRFRVTGADATYIVQAGDTQEDLLKTGHSTASLGAQWGVEPPASHGTIYSDNGTRAVPTERGRWDEFYPAFAAAVRGDGAAPVAARDAVATAVVLDAARISATTQRLVTVEHP